MKLCFPLEDLDTYEAFASESQDVIEEIEERVLRLEGVGGDAEVAPIFRCLHTLKGNSSFTKLNDFTSLSHQLENLFDLLRQQKLIVTGELIQLFLKNFDLLEQMVQDLRSALSRVETVGKFHVLHLRDIEVEEAVNGLVAYVGVSPSQAIQGQKESGASMDHNESNGGLEVNPHPQEITLSELEAVFEHVREIPPEPERPPIHEVEVGKNPVRIELETVKETLQEIEGETFVLTDEMKKSFHREAGESLAEMEQLALGLQKNPEDKFALLDLFRVLHSLKGNCGFFGLAEMESLSHRMESALGEFTKEGVQIGPNLVPVALQGIDALRLATADWAGGGSGRVANLESLLAEMDKLIRTAGKEVPLGEILISEGKVQPEEVEEALSIQKRKLGEILVDTGKIQEKDLSEALQKQKTMSPPGSGKTGLEGLSEASAPV
ncbi:MAG: Hpt domain-containing protein, partial [Spirochaetia bacterium]|nr:Hpt domain-containing protein [Spirochaetia bacterium]